MSLGKFCGLLSVLLCANLPGQVPQHVEVPAAKAIDHALAISSLTYQGRPFHAVMQIDEPKHPHGIYKSSVEVYWADPKRYRVTATSHDFSQTLIVNGIQIEETDAGDFYPGWLREFVMALMDPAPRATDATLRSGTVAMNRGQFMGQVVPPHGCARHEDRPNGITNEMTRVEVCVSDGALSNVQQFDYGVGFSKSERFGRKQIATEYAVMLSAFPADEYITFLTGRLTTLEPLRNPPAAMFDVRAITPPSGRILTTLVSTEDAAALLEVTPPMDWPPVAHGKTDGYLILHVITDRAGQVRSAWRVSADNSWVEPYAMIQALKFKFRPLMVDGVAHQMETPLVLHFKSAIDDSMPKFSGETISQVATGCKDAPLPTGLMPGGTQFTALVFVNEEGKSAGIDYADTVPIEMQRAANQGLYNCIFQQYSVNGSPTHYHVEFNFKAPDAPVARPDAAPPNQ
jgi:hypothetical protein